MTWRPELEEIAERKRAALELGGPDKVERHRAAGKLTARERIEGITDRDSFDEIGSIAGFPQYDEEGKLVHFTPANIVCGMVRIGGLSAFIIADDFTVRNG